MKYQMILLLAVFVKITAQVTAFQPIAALDTSLNENSGLIYYENSIYMVNDNENQALIYEVNPLNGAVLREIQVLQANNIDWEDMTQDQDYIYVGDIGNNAGNRTDLGVYKIAKSSLQNNTLTAIKLAFSYSDQTNFSPNFREHDFDAEALFSIGDYLYICTKNWVNLETKLYQLNKTATVQTAQFIRSYNVEGLISGGSYRSDNQLMVLSGYDENLQPFLVFFPNFNPDNNGTFTKANLDPSPDLVLQLESLDFKSDYSLYLSNEYFSTVFMGIPIESTAKLLEANIDQTLAINEQVNRNIEMKVYPNPASDIIYLDLDEISSIQKIELYDASGHLLKTWPVASQELYIADLSEGVYYLKIQTISQSNILKFIKK